MNKQLELRLFLYTLELTPEEQTSLWNCVSFYCDTNQSYMEDDEDGIKEYENAENILNIVNFLGKKTKIITFSSDEISVINHALNEQEELWGDKQGIEEGVVDENYHLIGHLGEIDKKIEALI
tara:strand:- start:36 stop:404 length:369 start_codon:yes stop_codon:yes gene_type:complete